MDDNRGLVVLLIIVALFMFGGDSSPLGPSVTSVVYVYEKDDTAVPSEVMAGINRLNREKKITATVIDDDVKDGEGQTPDQYKVPIEAANKSGLPSLVAVNGSTVVRVVKNPTTEQQVWEAAQ